MAQTVTHILTEDRNTLTYIVIIMPAYVTVTLETVTCNSNLILISRVKFVTFNIHASMFLGTGS